MCVSCTCHRPCHRQSLHPTTNTSNSFVGLLRSLLGDYSVVQIFSKNIFNLQSRWIRASGGGDDHNYLRGRNINRGKSQGRETEKRRPLRSANNTRQQQQQQTETLTIKGEITSAASDVEYISTITSNLPVDLLLPFS
jgi:hypothetical protein